MMGLLLFLLVVIIAVLILVVIMFQKNDGGNNEIKDKKNIAKKDTPIRSKHIMTNHEKTMFIEITRCLPECYVFPQVSFNSLITTKAWATRNKFNRKVADFVITNNKFNVLAVIELDDSSHKGKEQKDIDRDKMLKEGGYKVLRYSVMPPKDKLRRDVVGKDE